MEDTKMDENRGYQNIPEPILEEGLDTDRIDEGVNFTLFGDRPNSKEQAMIRGMRIVGTRNKRINGSALAEEDERFAALDEAVNPTEAIARLRVYESNEDRQRAILGIEGNYAIVDRDTARKVNDLYLATRRNPLEILAAMKPSTTMFYLKDPSSTDLSKRFAFIPVGLAAHLEGIDGFEKYASPQERKYERRGFYASRQH